MSFSKKKLLFILTICIITPFNNDVFIASIPSINQIFNTNNAQWLLSFGLISVAVSQLFIGALMDSYGRKIIIIIGMIIFVLGGLGIIFSKSFNVMLVFRVLQSIGASCCIVGAVAIAKDLVTKKELIFYTSFIFGIVSVSPFIAPILGSYLQSLFSWQGSFAFLVIIGILYLFFMYFLFNESIQFKDSIKLKFLLKTYVSFLFNVEYMKLNIINCISYIILFSIISVSSIVIVTQYNYGVLFYGHIFLLFSFTLLFMNIIAPKLSKKFSIKSLIRIGVILILIGSVLMMLLNLRYNNLYTFIIPCLIIGMGCGIIRPTASAAVMQIFPSKIAGKTIAFYTFSFYITSGIATLFTSYLIEYGVFCFSIFLFLLSLMAFTIKLTSVAN